MSLARTAKAVTQMTGAVARSGVASKVGGAVLRGGAVANSVAPMAFRAAAARVAMPSIVSVMSLSTQGERAVGEGANSDVSEAGEDEDGTTTRTGLDEGGEEVRSDEKEGEDAADSVENRIKELEAQVAALKDARLRALAELENVRRIAQRDVDSARMYGIQKFAKDLLDVSDNLARALDAVPEDKRSEGGELLVTLYEGVDGTRRELQKVFASHDIEEFGAKGEKFDPNLHQALFQVPASDEIPPGHIGEILKTGFKFKGRILRPAQIGATK